METINSVAAARPAPRPAPAMPLRQDGAIGIMFAAGLIIMIGFFALAIDLSQMYNRKMELQNAADTVALAAALELDGTTQGITNALQKAAERFTAAPPAGLTYHYNNSAMSWSDAAIEFGRGPAGPWKSASEAKTQPDGLLFAKVDTSGLDQDYGKVTTLFARTLTRSSDASTSGRAVAGRAAVKVTPLGICAMRSESHRNHNGELEEYGYRRGVAYNLLDLNVPAAAAGKTFLVNPFANSAVISDVATLAPFVCTGTMAMTRLTGGKVTVSSPFPIGSLYYYLNSRFGSYSAPLAACDARTAPSDANIKEYPYNGSNSWMRVTPTAQSAALLLDTDRRWTVAGPDTAPGGTTNAQFGVLWSYAKAVPYAAYQQAGEPEPAGGYSTYDTSAWATLYNPGQPTTSTTTPYPTSQSTPTPYSYTNGTTFFKTSPAGNKSVRNRRVLNLPLLECPVSGSKATVVGIGKFFMPVAATSNSLYGEFAGLVPEQSLGAQVELYP
jgi:Flp pilus assembly protein TadG